MYILPEFNQEVFTNYSLISVNREGSIIAMEIQMGGDCYE
jgi:hypothetical protein